MIAPLLQTKLHIPPVRSEAVSRPRLTDVLLSHRSFKLALVTASAGFGKTTLVSHWLALNHKRAAWISLDETENDLTRFLLYVATSLHQTSGEIGQAALGLLGNGDSVSPKAVLVSLINDAAAAPHDLFLILDDYHRIQAAEVHDAVTFLLDNLPPQLRIVLISRTQPPLPLSRLRSRHELVEVGTADLRFTWHEAEAFLNHTMRLGLSSAQITRLESRTEGWITGLQLIALNISGAGDADRIIRELSGDDRHIADYLVAEVISRQPAQVQRFLLHTSILTRLNAQVCNAVLDIQNSQDILEALERANLFLISLSSTRTWYRYHHLFANLLYRRLTADPSVNVAALHRRAAQWHFDHNMVEDGIEHSLLAQDYAVATERLHRLIDDEILAKGRFKLFLDWMDRIPDQHLARYPKLIFYQVFQLWEMQRLDQFYQKLSLIEGMLGPIPDNVTGLDAQTASHYGILSVIKGVVNCGSFAVEEASLCFQRALRLLPEESAFWRNLSIGATGFCLRIKGEYAEADKHFARVLEFATEAGLLWLRFQYGIARVQVSRALGRLTTALRTCDSLLQLDAEQGRQLPYAGVAYAMMGELLYLTGDLAAAEERTRQGLDLVTKDGDARHVADSYYNLARIHVARGELPEAVEVMDRLIMALGRLATPPSALLIARAYQASVWVACGELDRARRWMADPGDLPGDLPLPGDRFADVRGLPYFGVYCTVYEPVEKSIRFIRFTLARMELATGNAQAALQRLDALLHDETHGEDIFFQTQLMLLKAVALQAVQKPHQAVETLIASIKLFAPEPFVQLFLSYGHPLRDLLEAARDLLASKPDLAAPDARVWTFVESVLARMPKPQAPSAGSEQPSPAELSPREIEVLLALARGVSYGEISDDLMISLNTVKTYLKRIYSKLQVNNRLQAVNRAKELGLLP